MKFFKKIATTTKEVVTHPLFVSDQLYEYDVETEHLLTYILDHGRVLDVTDVYVHFTMPSKEIFSVWIAEAGYGSRGRISEQKEFEGFFYPGIKNLWEQTHASKATQCRLYDAYIDHTVEPEKSHFETYNKRGMFLEMNRYGEEVMYYKGSVLMDKVQWKKELAVWLLENV